MARGRVTKPKQHEIEARFPDERLEKQDRPLYKFLTKEGLSPFQRDSGWSLPTKNEDDTWTPGEWRDHDGPVITCVQGLHLSGLSGFMNWRAERLFEVEVDGPLLWAKVQDKFVAGRVRLIREVEPWHEIMGQLKNPYAYFPPATKIVPDGYVNHALPELVRRLNEDGAVTLARKVAKTKSQRELMPLLEDVEKRWAPVQDLIRIRQHRRSIAVLENEIRHLLGKPTKDVADVVSPRGYDVLAMSRKWLRSFVYTKMDVRTLVDLCAGRAPERVSRKTLYKTLYREILAAKTAEGLSPYEADIPGITPYLR